MSDAGLRLAYARLYDLLWRLGSPDMCPTAAEIQQALQVLDRTDKHGLGDLVLEVIPSIKSCVVLLAIERAAMKRQAELNEAAEPPF